MKPDIAIDDLLFGVAQVPVEAVIGTNGHTRRLTIPGKKALINQRTAYITGVLSLALRVYREAVSSPHQIAWHRKPKSVHLTHSPP